MKIGFFGKSFSTEFDSSVENLINQLHQKGNSIHLFKEFFDYLENRISFPEKIHFFTDYESVKPLDMLISIGGDGTMLSTLPLVKDSNVPVLGINTGRLGFLSTVGVEEIDETVNALVNNNYSIDTRSLIKVEVVDSDPLDFEFALNEVTIHKKETSAMITIDAWMDDSFISTYWADGLIVSTPTGSTAYSLSCGGPIAMPSSRNFIITPIAPHNLNLRPLIVSNDCVISLKAKGRENDYLLTLDSKSYTFSQDVSIRISKADFELNLIQLNKMDYFKTIRHKLNWGMDKRNY